MKKIIPIIILGLFININAYAISLFNNDSIPLDQSMNYFIKKGFKVVAQDTRGIRTAYVLKKVKDYVGCRTEGLSKKLICYKVTLIEND
jgi:hypothetical protein